MRVGVIAALVAFAAGCSHPSDHPVTLAGVAGPDWRLLRWDADGSHVPLVNGSEITLVIAADGKVGGNASINRYTGTMSIDKDGKVNYTNTPPPAAAKGIQSVTGAASVHALAVYPRRLPFQGLIAVASWAVGIGFIVTVAFNPIPKLWWWVQGLQLSYFGAGWLLLVWSYRLTPHPMAIVMRRLSLAVLGIVLVTTIPQRVRQLSVVLQLSMGWLAVLALEPLVGERRRQRTATARRWWRGRRSAT